MQVYTGECGAGQGGAGLISTWRVDDKLYLFAKKYLHVMKLPVFR